MAHKKSPAGAKHTHAGHEHLPAHGSARRYTYRGRTIAIEAYDTHAVDAGECLDCVMRIDGREVAYEHNDEGVLSHEFMFKRFSTPEELAEELVRQWGTSIPPAPHAHGAAHGGGNAPPKSPAQGRHPHRGK